MSAPTAATPSGTTEHADAVLMRLKSWLTAAAAASDIHILLTWAQSLDGCLARRRGHSSAISGAASLLLTHRLRASCSAIVVGVGTVLSDDPQLTARLVGGPHPQPIIIDPRLQTPVSCKLMTSPACLRPIIVCNADAAVGARHALSSRGATLLDAPLHALDNDGHMRLVEVLRRIREVHGVTTFMVEGGASLLRRALQELSAARVHAHAIITIAPVIMLGEVTLTGSGVATAPMRLRDVECVRIGDDTVLSGVVGAAL